MTSSSYYYEEDEEEVLKAQADTFSQSDDDDDNDEESSSSSSVLDDDEDDEGSSSWKSILVSAWKQHLFAILVAVGAAMYSHQHLAGPNDTSTTDRQHPHPSLTSHPKHAHLENFYRTANISFCHTLPPAPTNSMSISDSRMKLMDFYIPDHLVDTMRLFYHADVAEDDFYENLSDVNDDSQNNHHHRELVNSLPEYQCLLQLDQSPGTVRGSTYAYRTPSLEELYAYSNDEDENNEKQGGISTTGAASSLLIKNRELSVMKPSTKKKLNQPPLEFTGFGAKFVNLSPKPVLLYWEGKGGHADASRLVGEIAPFESIGTATLPGQAFFVSPVYDGSTALQRWVVTADEAVVVYEPYTQQEMIGSMLTPGSDIFFKYQMQLVNQVFARDYLIATQRQWLANFPRPFPIHYMHPADYMGQDISVESLPSQADDTTDSSSSLTLKVLSVTPRVYQIDNFLTSEECDYLISKAQEVGLHPSTLHSGYDAEQTRDISTRSSSNSWLPRSTSNITEQIYEKAAHVLQIDPKLFQKYSETDARHHSIAESLQVVRYKAGGEEYQPHHDFVYPSTSHRYQPTRFATLLLYLNTVPEGGETRFPRAATKDRAEGVVVQPKRGRAVLFYNMLPDGNVDDLSQHGSNPTTSHEKWLANLWVWDSVID